MDHLASDSLTELHTDRSSYAYQQLKGRLTVLATGLPCVQPASVDVLLNLTALELATCALVHSPYHPPALTMVAAVIEETQNMVRCIGATQVFLC